MIKSFDKEALFSLITDLYNVVGIRISIFDDQFTVVTEYPVDSPAICSLIRTTETGRKACRECDIAACNRAKKLQGPHIYQCHAGITEAITPIRPPEGITMGYAIFAHMLPEENYDAAIKTICGNCLRYGLEEAAVLDAAKQLRTQSITKIMSSIRLLDTIASYLHMKNLIRLNKEDLSVQIQGFIESNLAQNLASHRICRQFYISRTKLYQISMNSFGMGIMQYINYKRIEKAKELLEANGLSIIGIAAAVGINNYHYFYRLFKKLTGVSPSKFRLH